ncbi:hypothetical protein LAZ67_6002163 [Cordylochernes scorpioides]|uniref:PiggyBac transposable element-derived protein domain-containing protein n=1 Tax=Cordylochernes scorpioides TaxID=51811 RepID=A0ABY6KJM9_9ARAC|nr:hypothetical protein LAZ67_6002163 [Cordylochernes scorpioides]
MLHLNDNMLYIPHGQPGYDSIYKIRTLFDSLVNKFRTWYSPDEKLTIYEAICTFHGRVHFRVYIKGKPHKYGIKICESSTGWFSSPQLFNHLLEKKTVAVGTVRHNRKELPKKAFSKKLKKGESLFCQNRQLLALKWLDTRDVLMIATIPGAPNPGIQDEHQRTRRDEGPFPVVSRYSKTVTVKINKHYLVISINRLKPAFIENTPQSFHDSSILPPMPDNAEEKKKENDLNVKFPCKHCGKRNHTQERCFFKNAKCHAYGKLGHVERPSTTERKGKELPAFVYSNFTVIQTFSIHRLLISVLGGELNLHVGADSDQPVQKRENFSCQY